MYNKDNGDNPKKKPKKELRKGSKQERVFARAAIRDIKGKRLNERQESALKEDKGGMSGSMHQTSKSQREAAQGRFDEETRFLKETKPGQRILKVQAKKGTSRTEPRFNLEKREIRRKASESAFKDNQYEKIKGMYK